MTYWSAARSLQWLGFLLDILRNCPALEQSPLLESCEDEAGHSVLHENKISLPNFFC